MGAGYGAKYPLEDDTYYALGNIYCDDIKDKWLSVKFPDDVSIRHRNVAFRDGYYAIKAGETLITSVMTRGGDPDEAMFKLLEDLDKVKIIRGYTTYPNFLLEYDKRKKEIEKLGLDF